MNVSAGWINEQVMIPDLLRAAPHVHEKRVVERFEHERHGFSHPGCHNLHCRWVVPLRSAGCVPDRRKCHNTDGSSDLDRSSARGNGIDRTGKR